MLDKPGLCWGWPPLFPVALVDHQVTGTNLESSTYAFPWPFGLGGRQQRSRLLFLKAEKIPHPMTLAGEGLGAVAQIHRLVQFGMGFDQRRRHRGGAYKSASEVVFVGQTSGLLVSASSGGVAADPVQPRAFSD